MRNDIDTVRGLIMAAGGFAEVARKVGARRRETVRWWAVNNRVPPRWIPQVARVLDRPESYFWRLYSDFDRSADFAGRYEMEAVHVAR